MVSYVCVLRLFGGLGWLLFHQILFIITRQGLWFTVKVWMFNQTLNIKQIKALPKYQPNFPSCYYSQTELGLAHTHVQRERIKTYYMWRIYLMSCKGYDHWEFYIDMCASFYLFLQKIVQILKQTMFTYTQDRATRFCFVKKQKQITRNLEIIQIYQQITGFICVIFRHTLMVVGTCTPIINLKFLIFSKPK